MLRKFIKLFKRKKVIKRCDNEFVRNILVNRVKLINMELDSMKCSLGAWSRSSSFFTDQTLKTRASLEMLNKSLKELDHHTHTSVINSIKLEIIKYKELLINYNHDLKNSIEYKTYANDVVTKYEKELVDLNEALKKD